MIAEKMNRGLGFLGIILGTFILTLFLGMAPEVVNASGFFTPPPPPAVGSPPVPSGGVRSMWQSLQFRPWWKADRSGYQPNQQVPYGQSPGTYFR
jgi:hypothetical protein